MFFYTVIICLPCIICIYVLHTCIQIAIFKNAMRWQAKVWDYLVEYLVCQNMIQCCRCLRGCSISSSDCDKFRREDHSQLIFIKSNDSFLRKSDQKLLDLLVNDDHLLYQNQGLKCKILTYVILKVNINWLLPKWKPELKTSNRPLCKCKK